MKLHKATTIAMLLAIGLTACGAPAAPEPTPTPAPMPTATEMVPLEPVDLDLCSLLLDEEVMAELDQPVQSTDELGMGACTYTTTDGEVPLTLSVSAAQGEDARGLILAGLQIAVMFGGSEDTLAAGQALSEEAATLSLWEVVDDTYAILAQLGYQVELAPSFGETALWGWSEPQVSTLILVEDDTYLSLNVVGLDMEEARRVASLLAPQAMDRLPPAFTVPTSGSIGMETTIELGETAVTMEAVEAPTAEPTVDSPPAPPSAAVWVTNYTEDVVYRIDPYTMEIVAIVDTGEGPVDLEVYGDSLFVANQGDGSIWKIDPVYNVVNYRVNTGASEFLRVEVDENYIYAMACHEHMIEIFHYPDTRALFARIPIQDCWNAEVAFGSLWVGVGERTLLRIDPETQEEIASMNVGRGPNLMDVTEDWLWVANANQGGLWRINPDINSMFDIVGIPVAGNVLDIVVGEGAVWAAVDHYIVKLDPDSGEVLGMVDTLSRANGVAVGFGYVYVTNYVEGTVMRLDAETLEMIDSVQVGGSPWGIAITE